MARAPTTEEEARAAVRELIPQQPDMIKIIYDKGSQRFTSLSYELMEAIIDESHQNGFQVITHITTLEHAKDAVRAGSDGLAHMVVDTEVDEELLQAMRQQDVFCIPTLSVFAAFAGEAAEEIFLNSSLVTQGVPREVLKDLKSKEQAFLQNSSLWTKYFNFAQTNLKKRADAGINLVLGTDAGNPYVCFGPSCILRWNSW
jgi:imidazolonepropionase-like amidohydrolase